MTKKQAENGDFEAEDEFVKNLEKGEHDHPDVIMKPPKLYGLFLLGAIVLELIVWNPDMMSWGAQFGIGMLLISLGFGLATACIMRFSDAGTNIPTDRPVTALVTDGAYRYSRNPIYFALTSLYLGLCVLFDLFWGFLFLAPLLYVMNRYVIAREEDYLENKFGEPYRNYKQRTRRWF